jgi:hypothetical protein
LQPHDDGSITSLDELAPQPSISRTWPVALGRALMAKVTGKKEVLPVEADDDEQLDEDDVEVEPYSPGSAGAAEDAPRGGGSRAAQLRAQRQKKSKSSRESTPGTATNTEGEGGADDTNTEDPGSDADGKPRRRGPGKANAARRRKMGMKK